MYATTMTLFNNRLHEAKSSRCNEEHSKIYTNDKPTAFVYPVYSICHVLAYLYLLPLFFNADAVSLSLVYTAEFEGSSYMIWLFSDSSCIYEVMAFAVQTFIEDLTLYSLTSDR